MDGVGYRYELRRADRVIATGRVSREEPLDIGDTIEIGGHPGIVRTISPLLGEARAPPGRRVAAEVLAISALHSPNSDADRETTDPKQSEHASDPVAVVDRKEHRDTDRDQR